MGDSTFSGGWIFAFLIIAVIFGWGGNGLGNNNAANAAYATMADVNSAINNQTVTQGLSAIQLQSANNDLETARQISDQNMSMMQQNNTNLLAAINGFNTVNQNIASGFNALGMSISSGFNSVNQNLADLGYRMDRCCCDIKTSILENRLQDTQIALQNAQNQAVNAAQSQYLLSQLGTFVPTVAAV